MRAQLGRFRAGRRWRWQRCRPDCPGHRPSRPALRGFAVRPARPRRAVRCRRTSSGRTRMAAEHAHVRAHRLESALCVGEAGPKRGVQQKVVTAGDEFPPRAANYPGRPRQPGADRHVAVPRHQGGDQRKKGREVRRQIDVHVGDDASVAGSPDVMQRATATFGREVDGPHVRQLVGQLLGDGPGAVGAGVVGDGDHRRERELVAQVRVQSPHARSRGLAPRCRPGRRSRRRPSRCRWGAPAGRWPRWRSWRRSVRSGGLSRGFGYAQGQSWAGCYGPPLGSVVDGQHHAGRAGWGIPIRLGRSVPAGVRRTARGHRSASSRSRSSSRPSDR